MLERSFAIAVTLCVLMPALAASAADNKSDSKWNDQDSWERFSDKEQKSTFKVDHSHIEPNGESVLAPVLSTRNKPRTSSDPGQSYVILPGQSKTDPIPQVHTQTTYVPVVRQAAPYLPTYGGVWGGGFGRYGGYGRYGGWGGGLYGTPWGFGGYGPAPSTVMMRPMSKVVQTGPSKPSGNYYAESTPDPTASGNYYASPSGLPKAAPIVHQDGKPDDYWGNSGNPLPKDMQP